MLGKTEAIGRALFIILLLIRMISHTALPPSAVVGCIVLISYTILNYLYRVLKGSVRSN